ncbi:MAG TPA: SusC/RagA family TonB-linked outer membrane protein [Mucilaginibacter sp.]|jgi:TonB-linked SusC/RagA family outer membrane protein|nr:SusC/RagA family TonB-linked outer membrane protein [Mucilaginibacter sp.]
MNFYTLFNPVRKKRGRLFKTLLVMKLVIILITVACLQVSASALAQKKVTLNEKDAPLEKVFNDIKEQTGCNFLYEHNILNGTSKVTINVKDANLPDVLNLCLANQPLVYTIAGNNIGVKKKEIQPAESQAPKPPKDVTGQVLDSKGIPLVSATVLIKRTKTGTLTDVKGNFTLHNVSSTDVITVTYIGYKPLEIQIGDKTVFNLVMEETKNSLDQVVVQAYGQTSQRLNTGDIATVSAKEIADQPIMNPLTALEGKVPGLVVQQDNGYASAPFKIEIRGRSELNPDIPSDPLYIIDGVPLTILETGKSGNYASGSAGITQNGINGPAGGQSPLFGINPNDIESISVLKDADATAIYGSRGANGVIIITTKSGKAGKTTVDGVFNEGLSVETRRYDMLNTQQYIAMREEAFKNSGITPTLSNPNASYDLLQYDINRYTNLQNFLFGHTGKTTDAQLALSGGDKQNTFRIAGSFHHETDITTFSGANERATVQTNYTHKSLDQRLSLIFTSTYSFTNINIISLPGQTTLPPDIPAAYKADGSLNWSGWAPIYNPFGQLLQPYTASTGFLNSHLAVNYQIIKGLTFNTSLGYSTSHQSQTSVNPIASQDPIFNPVGSAEFGINDNYNAIIEPQLEYKRTIAKGTLDALIGGSYQSIKETGDAFTGIGYTNDFLINSLSNAPITTGTDDFDLYKYTAGYGRINYNWVDEFIINLSARRDGSTRFGPGRQFGNFWAAGGAWIFTQEETVKKLIPFLSFGKLRGSYGTTGSDAIGDYGYLSRWADNTNSTYISGLSAYSPLGLSNPTLQWQVNKKLEAAIDLGFFKDRLTLDFSVYRDRVGNQLVQEPLPSQTGFTQVTTNLNALIENRGVEATIHAKIINQKDFSWDVNFDIGSNRNKLLSFPGLSESPYANLYIVGQPLDITRLLHYTGIDPLTGQYVFQDKNHNGVVDPTYNNFDDSSPVDLEVKCDGGFGTDVKIKNFTLNAFFRFRVQTLPSIIKGVPSPGSIGNEPTIVLNRWQKPGDNSEFAPFTTSQTLSESYYQSMSDATYINGSYVRFQNLAIYYDIPDGLLKKVGVRACKIFFQGENLFLITKYPGADPDTPGFGGLAAAKTFVAGIHFTL